VPRCCEFDFGALEFNSAVWTLGYVANALGNMQIVLVEYAFACWALDFGRVHGVVSPRTQRSA
jgi:hypothetical protein